MFSICQDDSIGNAVVFGSWIIVILVSNPHKYITSNTVKLIGNMIQNSKKVAVQINIFVLFYFLIIRFIF